MATLDELQVKLTLEASQFNNGLRQADAQARRAAGQMSGAFAGLRAQILALSPALVTASLVTFGKRAIDAAGHIKDMADRIGFAATTLSALEPVLAANGSGLDDFAASVGILSNQMGEAAKGNQEAVKAFDQLGLSVAALQRMNPEQRFYAVTEALMKLGDQARITEAGRNLLGRGFLAMLPTLREYNGKMDEAVAATTRMGDALSEETINRIDAFGDAMSNAAIKARNAFLEAFAAVLQVTDAIDGGLEHLSAGNAAGGFAANKIGITPESAAAQAYAAKAKSLGFVSQATFMGSEQFGPPAPSARGSNAGLLKATGGKSKAREQAEDYDKLNDSLDEYIRKMEDETRLLGMTERERDAARAVMQAQNLAMKDGSLLTEEQIEHIRALSDAQHDLTERMEESRETAREWQKQLSDGLTDIIMNFDSAKDAAKGFFDEIAKQVLNKHVSGPLSSGIMGMIGNAFGGGGTTLYSGFGANASSRTVGGGIGGFLGGLLGFADGGSPPVGVPSVVGERGPEIFVPGVRGTIIPNHALSGGGVTVQQNIYLSPGIQGTVEAEVRRAAPYIASLAEQKVFNAIQRGGAAERIVGKR